jgi:hypothetical protein
LEEKEEERRVEPEKPSREERAAKPGLLERREGVKEK